MHKLTLPGKIKRSFSIQRYVMISLMAILFLSAVGCQSGQADSATVAVDKTQPPSTATVPPTATPLPTATSVPTETPEPTATVEPSPTPRPTKVPTPEIVTIPYMDPETEEDPRTMPQWLKIYRPAEVAAPYPTIFLLPSTANSEITDYYQRVAKRFMARGYAIVLVNVGDKMAEEGDLYLQKGLGATNIGAKACALAWVTAFGGDYDLDLERLAVFSNSYEGPAAARMPLYDEAMWVETLSACAYPVPAPGAVKAVVTANATLGMPDSALSQFSGKFGESWNIAQQDIMPMIESLNATPPKDWHKAGVLDEDTHNRLARLLPLYWVYQAQAEGRATPSYLLFFASNVNAIPAAMVEAEDMAEHMRIAGIDVTLEAMDKDAWLMDSTTVAEEIVEATDAFLSELFE